MLKARGFRAAHIILLAVAINALAVTSWLALRSILPIGITPGFGPSRDIAAGAGSAEALGPAIVWFVLLVVAGVMVAARTLLMRWIPGRATG